MAFTRLGLGGPSQNYSRPISAKAESLIVAVAVVASSIARNIASSVASVITQKR